MILAILLALAPTLVVLLGMSALISAAETSMTAASRGRMHQLERDGDKAAARVNLLLTDPRMIAPSSLQQLVTSGSALTTTVLSRAVPVAWASPSPRHHDLLIVIFADSCPDPAITRADDVSRPVLPT